MDGIFLLIGTNLGDRAANLEIACLHVSQLVGTIIQKSSIYQTNAWGVTDQQSFLNQAIKINTPKSPQHLLISLQEIEKSMGRKRVGKWMQRIIDIDILYYYDHQLNEAHLKIPHPLIQERNFALVPMVELAGNQLHPVLNRSQANLLESCQDNLHVELWEATKF